MYSNEKRNHCNTLRKTSCVDILRPLCGHSADTIWIFYAQCVLVEFFKNILLNAFLLLLSILNDEVQLQLYSLGILNTLIHICYAICLALDR